MNIEEYNQFKNSFPSIEEEKFEEYINSASQNEGNKNKIELLDFNNYTITVDKTATLLILYNVSIKSKSIGIEEFDKFQIIFVKGDWWIAYQ